MLRIRWIAAVILLAAGLQSTGWCARPTRDSSPDLFISVQGDRVTARIEGASLRQVLAELHRKTGVRTQFTDPGDDATVWKTFTDVPLVDALYRLLEGRSFALYYNAPPAAAPPAGQALVVRILPPPVTAPASDSRGAAVASQPVPIMQSPPAADLPTGPHVQSASATPDNGTLEGATLDELGQAMVDPDEPIRARAQAMFDQTLTKQVQPAASTPTSRR